MPAQHPDEAHRDEPPAPYIEDEDDDDLEEFLEGWAAVDRDAVELLRGALSGHRGRFAPRAELQATAVRLREELHEGWHPHTWVRDAARLRDEPLPDDDAELLVRCAAAVISPLEETGLDAEEESVLLSLEHADWLALVIVLVRRGAGADASMGSLADTLRHCPEVPLEEDFDVDDESHVEAAFSTVALAWIALGLIDREDRLTALGEWVLPRALARAWEGDFDAG